MIPSVMTTLAGPFKVRSRMILMAASMMLVGGCLHAQVVELSGGTSTLFQSQGGMVTVHGPGYSASGGAGTIGGQIYGGAQFEKSFERGTLILGSDHIPFDLPTDVFEGGHYLTALGAGVRTKVDNANVYGFVGETSNNFNSPFFDGAQLANPALILFVSGKVAPQWTAATRVIFSKQVTVIHSFSWDSGDGMKFAISGGVGSNQLYAATSLSIERPRFDLKAAYIEAGSQFRRADVATPLTSEPDRDNVLLTVRPARWLTVSAGRQNYLTPVYESTQNVRSSVNQASVNVQADGFAFAAMAFQSVYGDSKNLAFAYSAGRAIGSRVHVDASYLVSRPDGGQETDSTITSVQETLTPRWTISQMVNTSEGRSTFGFGGSFLSNFATVSADYQTYYVAANTEAPFEQALILNAQIHLFGRLTVDGGTFVAPDGRLLYTTDARGTVSRETSGAAGAFQHNPLGNMLLRGRVIDSNGQPVMGAAVLVDQLELYSDSQGYFYVRERKSHQHPLTVLVDQFLDGARYRVVSAPTETRSSANTQPDAIIVVEKVTSASVRG